MFLRALVVLLLFWSHAAFAQVPAWRVTEAAGAVQVQHGGRTAAAARGAALQPGDVVTTGANGRAVLVRGQEYVIVAALTRLRLPAAAEERGIVQMLQDWGRATFRIEKKATPHFGVKTPYLVALVKGTVFTVTADGKGAEVAVTEGRVEVGTSDGTVRQMVDAGMAASIASAQPGRIEMQPAAAAAGGTSEAARACAADGARSCGPKLEYEPVEVADSLTGPDAGVPAGPGAMADATLGTPLTTALLDLDALPPAAPSPPAAPAPAPAPDPAPASPADPTPAPPADPAPAPATPAPAPAPAPGESPAPAPAAPAPAPAAPAPAPDPVPATPARPADPATPAVPAPGGPAAPAVPAVPPPPANPGSNSGPGSGTPLPPAPAPAPTPETLPPPLPGPAPAPAPGPAPTPETLPPPLPGPAPAPAPGPAPTPETLPPPLPGPDPAPAPAPTPPPAPPPAPVPAPAPGPTPETLPPAPVPAPAPAPPPSPVPPPAPSCRLIQLLIVCL